VARRHGVVDSSTGFWEQEMDLDRKRQRYDQQNDVARALTLSDGVFAIVITISSFVVTAFALTGHRGRIRRYDPSLFIEGAEPSLSQRS
jgi:hypothetical protein